MRKIINACSSLNGIVSVPGDKSISHRAVMFAALAEGKTEIHGFLRGADCLSTVRCMQQLGVDITDDGQQIIVVGCEDGLKEPDDVLNVGNSGTTLRLLLGLLSGQGFYATLTGDDSIRRRPMKRVTGPLQLMGACIGGKQGAEKAPLSVIPSQKLHGIDYVMPMASAQVKSALLLAGLYANGPTTITEPILSRDHSERMLQAMGANIRVDHTTVVVTPGARLSAPGRLDIPGDISSAAFMMIAASIVPNSRITITNVGINPTRTGIIDVLTAMNGNITLTNRRVVSGEPVADITICSSDLKGTVIDSSIIPRLVDEIPILAVAAVAARGRTEIRGAQELRVKESDRLAAIATELGKLGAVISELPDGLVIEGGSVLHGNICRSYDDHRMAMALAVAGLIAFGPTTIENSECVDVSFPKFFTLLEQLAK